MWAQHRLTLRPLPRGVHIITREIVQAVPELADVRVGLLHLHLLHTSASLTINESADPDVLVDLETSLSAIAPDGDPRHIHTLEGPDDMAAHVKASLVGSSLTIPVGGGQLLLGTWQGVQLAEHRDRASARSLILTLHGDPH